MRNFLSNIKGEMMRVIAIALSLFVAGVLLPLALVKISNSQAYTGVNASVVTVATVLLPVLAVIGIALMYLPTRK